MNISAEGEAFSCSDMNFRKPQVTESWRYIPCQLDSFPLLHQLYRLRPAACALVGAHKGCVCL